MNTPFDPNNEFETELISSEDLAEMDIEVFEAMMNDPQPGNSETLGDAINDVVEEIVGVDIDGDGFINDKLDVEAFGPDSSAFGVANQDFDSGFAEVEVINVSNVEMNVDMSVNEIQIDNSVEMLEAEAGTDFDESSPNTIEQESFDAAVLAQAKVDEAIEVGDYEAAHYHRRDAEIEAEYAGNDSMLHGSDSTDLEWADYHQDQAMESEAAQAANAQSGDYAAARENALDAAYQMRDADWLAGGSDHSGQAMLEVNQMDWADWHQQQSDQMLSDATAYTEDGNFDAAENQLDSAAHHLDQASMHGDLGTHGGEFAVYDPTADIQSNDFNSYSGDTSMPDTSIDTSYTDNSTDFTV